MWLDDPQIDSWRALLTHPPPLYIRFFINNISQKVHIANGTHFYTHYSVTIDPNFTIQNPGFAVTPLDPVAIVHQDDPNLRPGFLLNLTFAVFYGSAPPVATPASPVGISIAWVIFFVFFLLTLLLFLVNLNKFVTLPAMIDVRSRPVYSQNLHFFTCAGLTELIRLGIASVVFDPADTSVALFANLSLVSAVLPSLFRVWAARSTGQFVSDFDYSAFPDLGLFFTATPLLGFPVLTRLLFGAFRGLPLWHYPILYAGQAFGLLMTSSTPGLMLLTAMPWKPPYFIAKENRKMAFPSFFRLTVYGVLSATLANPIVAYVMGLVYDDVKLDFLYLTAIVLSYAAFCGFVGLWRTIERLTTGKGLWQDDHMMMHAMPALLAAANAIYRAFCCHKLYWLDISGVALCGFACSGVAAAAFTFGTMASWGISFVFVYFAIIRVHARDEPPRAGVDAT
jgi:hypothetical protein